MAAELVQDISVRAGERDLVDYLVEQIDTYRREAVVNYYVTLKSKRFVVLAGPPDVDKISLAQGVAEALVGTSSFQWSCFQAHPWWSTHTGDPRHFAMAHARFNALKMNDLIELALQHESQQRPFLLGVKRMSRAEVACYFQDLPCGLLWRPDASAAHIRLPSNLFVTGTLDVEDDHRRIWSQDVSPHAAVIRIRHDDLAFQETYRRTTWQDGDWEQQFVRSRVHHTAQARAKLARTLPSGSRPLAPLHELGRHSQDAGLPPHVLEEAWLYLANAFDEEGRGLFIDSAAENLAIAQDYVLVQNVLPRIYAQCDGRTVAVWEDVREYLAPLYPRAHAWTQRLVS